jgi:translation initiation factor IF-2
MTTIETRLRRLEAASPDRKASLFVIEGRTEAERQAQIDALIQSGEARASDLFIVTGVTRSPTEFGSWNEPNG